MDQDPWLSTAAAADMLGVSVSTVYRTLADPETATAEWGPEGEGWRIKPLSRRAIRQVRQSAVQAKLRGDASGGRQQ